MRLSAKWMTLADDRILEYLDQVGPRTPSKIAADDRVRFSRTYINTRCVKLAQADLVDNLGNGVYQINETGKEYLTGNLDALELVEPE